MTIVNPGTSPVSSTAEAAPRPPDRKRRRTRRRAPRWLPYAFLLPALLLELLVHFAPIVLGMAMSAMKVTQYQISHWWQAPFTGLGNFRVVLDFDNPTGKSLLHSFWITLGFTAIVLSAAWGLGLAAALALQHSFRGRGVLRALFLVPYALPAYAAVITWRFIFQRDNGMLNHLLNQAGLTDGNPFWLIGSNAFWAQCIVAVWRMWPFAFLILMAGMQSIPSDVYEAAGIDGAGPWRQLRSITLPLLTPVNKVLVLVMFLHTFNDFNTPYILFGGGAPSSADLISVHIYQSSFATWDFGLGSAMSVLLLLFLLAVTSVYLAVTRRAGHDT
ncbi:ABC-type transporter, integral membrane subunit [Actinobacteria bacterium OK074]|nr:ABC-type transporter, integral membrane subunit [Actinobacteria bacterium OK074]